MGRRSVIGLVIGLLLALPAYAEAKEHQFVGVKKCKSCHKKEAIGDQYGKWKAGKHATAFETLASDKAKEFASKAAPPIDDPQTAEECLKCHVTAYGVPEARVSKKFDQTLGVQCESCHGAGKGYRKKKIMVDREKAEAKGLVIPDEKVCTGCHNSDSPTWDPQKGFDFEQAAKEIAHAVPEDYDSSKDEDEEEAD